MLYRYIYVCIQYTSSVKILIKINSRFAIFYVCGAYTMYAQRKCAVYLCIKKHQLLYALKMANGTDFITSRIILLYYGIFFAFVYTTHTHFIHMYTCLYIYTHSEHIHRMGRTTSALDLYIYTYS